MNNDTDLVDDFLSIQLVFLLFKDVGLPLFLFHGQQVFPAFSNLLSFKSIMFVVSVMYVTVFALSLRAQISLRMLLRGRLIIAVHRL